VIKEWLCASLAREMMLPVCEGVMVEVPEEFLALESAARLGVGIGFGSLELPYADTIQWRDVEKLPPQLRARVLLFDYWIQNLDRTLGPAGGNPNLLRSKGTPLALIDHGNAFDAAFDPSECLAHHAFADSRVIWHDRNAQADWQRDAMEAALTIPDLWGSIPDEWHENDFGDPLHHLSVENIDSILKRFEENTPAFWSPLGIP
jgi:hypothetical protein